MPNFFMIGFPKCGTSAVASYLSTNPQVFFSRIKEPYFWASDFPRSQRHFGITTLPKYMELFEEAGPQHSAVCEGSTNYIFSSVAVQEILAFNPSARFLVMLRNPVKWVQSWHNELLFSFQEDVMDFESAWNLQPIRAQGQNLPKTPTPPFAKTLQYRDVGCFANFLEPIVRILPPEQLKVVLLEEFTADHRKSYADLCQFIGVDDDGRTEFPRVRESQAHVWPALSRFLKLPPKWLEPAAITIRRLGWTSGVVGHAKSMLRRKKQRPTISEEFEQELQDTFAPANERLEDLLGRSLDAWRNKSSLCEMKS